MSAIVTDQFRILNASNFVNSISDSSNSYYVFFGLPNPTQVGFGRTASWNTNVPSPVDNFTYENHISDTSLFGQRITVENVRRVIRRIDWVQGTRYEMYRQDYSLNNPSPLTSSSRLYDTNYYVLNSNYSVYICISNGSSGTNPLGNTSQDEPTFTDLEPAPAGVSGDGYLWKYLFTINPSDIIKFDSTEYIPIPNNWESSSDFQISSVRENGNSDINQNQIKKVYIQDPGNNYPSGLGQEVNINGDGNGAKVVIDVVNNKISNATVSSGGSGYTYGIVDLGAIGNNTAQETPAKLIPIIPPSKGHGYDIYKELGADKILIYAKFDDSTKDYPLDTSFSQVGIIKNPTIYNSNQIYSENSFSSLHSIKINTINALPVIGEKIRQVVSDGTGIAIGYVASFDAETKVLKYFRDRSLYFNQTKLDETDYVGISSASKVYDFESTANPVIGETSGFAASIDTTFSEVSVNPNGNKIINLGVSFTNGLANPDINKGSGDLIYIDNRPTISRNSRQKEEVKIILEF
jgi:hypothetical protein